jgi:RNA polymerase sigma-70 factor (ECF subfamily)
MYNEQEAILQCQGGKTQAFGLIYDKHVKTIYNFIYYKVFDKETAEDITSQTFFKALKNMSSVDPERPIISWLYKIAHNSILDHYRAQRHNEDIDDYWDIHDEDIDVIGKLDTEVEATRVKKYLKELNTTERDIIFMRVWQEMPYQEIAEIIGKSEANCKMIYSRAMKKLKTLIK